jgi:ABC-type uncharacterized transport system substrate-binding protein
MTAFIGRREFIALAGGAAAAWPLAARAQQSERMRRVGVLMNGNERDSIYQAYIGAFVQTLQRLSWREGQNLRIDVRWPSADPERIGAYAAELVGMTPDVILCSGSASLAALLRTTGSIKAVFVLVSDPVAQGFVTNLAHPGGNITGFSAFEPSTSAEGTSAHRTPVAQWQRVPNRGAVRAGRCQGCDRRIEIARCAQLG